ncbi:zf-RING_2 domain-containing protein [Cephalotus follicularis]|uniref:RING-type E3 ubiquitin transferase n=1 Tax=Cephalotus follicularis TaxID=3775 RepID=A0A1Q3BVY3_CEPFO|nr:zf-RING_2 domain-containing protein [Cephalotus follicularis]
MKPYNRKLILHDGPQPPSFTNSPLPLHKPITTAQNSTSPSPPPSAAASKKPYETQQPPTDFDSSVALTLLVLLTALFFIGFFSIYIRRFADDTAVDISSRRRHHREPHDSSPSPSHRPSIFSSRKGVDPAAVRSLPVYSYRGDSKYQIECCVCLRDFEENETVKMIPFCKHMFHLRCIDTWLAAHVTCPVCRGAQLFEVRKSDDLSAVEIFDRGLSELNGRGTMEIGDTCMEMRDVGSLGLRRTRSSSNVGERVLLKRTSSF